MRNKLFGLLTMIAAVALATALGGHPGEGR